MKKGFIITFETSALVYLDTEHSAEELTDEEKESLIEEATRFVDEPSKADVVDIMDN